MSRLLFLVIIVVLVFWLLKSYGKRLRKDETSDENATGQTEDMVRCAQCGVHLPKRESLLASGKYYCSEAHRRMHADKTD